MLKNVRIPLEIANIKYTIMKTTNSALVISTNQAQACAMVFALYL